MKRLWIIMLSLLFAVLISAAGVVWWLATPTSVYYRQISAQVEQTDQGEWIAYITREMPRGDFVGKWSLKVWVRRGENSFLCNQPTSEPITYDASRGPTISYELPNTVTRCMNEAPPISLIWTRQAMLWGWIPMRPVEYSLTINPTPDDRTETDR